MKSSKRILLTRTWHEGGVSEYKDRIRIKKFIEEISDCFDKIIVLVNFEKEKDYYTQILLSRLRESAFKNVDIVYITPWGNASGALNVGLVRAFQYTPEQIMIASKEVKVSRTEINTMSGELEENNELIVVGLMINANIRDNVLGDFSPLNKKEVRGHYLGSKDWAFRIPWNTCAIWDVKLFQRYIGCFNVFCDCSRLLQILGENFLNSKEKKKLEEEKIRLGGMEDFLAIGLALQKESSLKFKLVSPCSNGPNWLIKDVDKHIKKMWRKPVICKLYSKFFSLPGLLFKRASLNFNE